MRFQQPTFCSCAIRCALIFTQTKQLFINVISYNYISIVCHLVCCFLARRPQGSRLGPLLFILYVNDILDDLESEVMIFVDDTTLLATGHDPAETSATINRDLQKISEWATKWKVTFNASKSKDMIFSNKQLFNSPPIVFNNTFVKRVAEHKHLGLWLSPSLSWSKHVHETCLKASRKLYVLRSVKFLNRRTLDMLYKIQIRSCIDYMLPVYYHTLKTTEKARLDQVQYRAGLLASSTLYFTSKDKLNIELGWETLSDRADFLGLTLFQKIHLKQTRPLIFNCMSTLNEFHSRSKGNYKLFPNFGSNFSNSYFPYFTKRWNSLSNHIKSKFDLIDFKEELKTLIKPKKYRHFNKGSKIGNANLTRLRVGRSFLNSHSFSIGHSESPLCLCHFPDENPSHFLLSCWLYNEERQTLLWSVNQLVPVFNSSPKRKQLEILLFGHDIDNPDMFSTNIKLQLLVQKFILDTKRFDHPTPTPSQ